MLGRGGHGLPAAGSSFCIANERRELRLPFAGQLVEDLDLDLLGPRVSGGMPDGALVPVPDSHFHDPEPRPFRDSGEQPGPLVERDARRQGEILADTELGGADEVAAVLDLRAEVLVALTSRTRQPRTGKARSASRTSSWLVEELVAAESRAKEQQEQ